MDKPLIIDHFNGVYLLYSLNDKYFGKTYIGYTVNPNRRIRQHNRGKKCGGAKRTSNRGPWKMVLIIHGFPNSISALRFEWAWQNPEKSRRLNHVDFKKKIPRKETTIQYNLRILSEMLRVGPWNRLPLTIRWLESEYAQEFTANRIPPMHMPICYGPIIGRKKSNAIDKNSIKNNLIETNSHSQVNSACNICFDYIKNCSDRLTCLNIKCDFVSHLQCLANMFLINNEYIPVEGDCPKCDKTLLWGDLIRKMKGCDDLEYNSCNDQSDSDKTADSEDAEESEENSEHSD